MEKKQVFKILILVVSILVLLGIGSGGAFLYKKIIEPNSTEYKNQNTEIDMKKNILLLEGIVRMYEYNYEANEEGIKKVEIQIKNYINEKDKKIENPVTHKSGVIKKENIDKGGAVIYIPENDNSEQGISNLSNWPEHLPKAKGMVAYGAYKNIKKNTIAIKLIPYDENGNKMTNLEKIIN